MPRLTCCGVALAAGLHALLATLPPTSAVAQCPESTLVVYTGGGSVICPCFGVGEQAAVVLQAPAAHYPIEILRVGIGWASQSLSTPPSIEEAVHIFAATPPSPGLPIFSLQGPQLTDNVINEYDLEPQPGEIVVPSGPFTLSLEFANANEGDPSAASVVHDGNGCQAGKNYVYAIPGGWQSACALGVTGDWVMYAIYRRVNCATGVGEELVLGGGSPALMPPRPNPAADGATIEYYLPRADRGTITVFDVAGREVGRIVDDRTAAGRHRVAWDGRGADGRKLKAGIYVLELRVGERRMTRKLAIAER